MALLKRLVCPLDEKLFNLLKKNIYPYCSLKIILHAYFFL